MAGINETIDNITNETMAILYRHSLLNEYDDSKSEAYNAKHELVYDAIHDTVRANLEACKHLKSYRADSAEWCCRCDVLLS